mgnify:CR=1 FL=1
MRPASCPRVVTAASASGKLAPHRIADGSTTQSARTTSNSKPTARLDVSVGLTGQYGSDSVSVRATSPDAAVRVTYAAVFAVAFLTLAPYALTRGTSGTAATSSELRISVSCEL